MIDFTWWEIFENVHSAAVNTKDRWIWEHYKKLIVNVRVQQSYETQKPHIQLYVESFDMRFLSHIFFSIQICGKGEERKVLKRSLKLFLRRDNVPAWCDNGCSSRLFLWSCLHCAKLVLCMSTNWRRFRGRYETYLCFVWETTFTPMIILAHRTMAFV